MSWSKEKCVKYSSIVGAHLATSPLSFLWIYGNLFAYMDSYFLFSCNPDCVNVDPQWILCLYMAFGGPGALFTKFMTDRLGQKWAGVVCAVFINASLLGSAWTVDVSVVWTTVLMGVVVGFCIGMIVSISYQNVSGWAPEKASILMATVSSLPSTLAMLENQLITAYVNPENLKPDVVVGPKTYFSQPEILARVPKAIIIFGCMTLSLQFIGFCLFTSSPGKACNPLRSNSDYVNENNHNENDQNDHTNRFELVKNTDNQTARHDLMYYGSNGAHRNLPAVPEIDNCIGSPTLSRDDRNASQVRKDGDNAKSLKPTEVLKTQVFYALLLFDIVQVLSLLLKSGSYKEFGLLYIHNDNFLTLVGTLLPIATTGSRIMYGILINKCILTIKDSVVLSLTLNAIFCAFWFFAPQVHADLYLVFILILSFAQSSVFAVVSAGCLRIFGPEHFATNYGMLQTGMMVAGVMGPLVITNFIHTLGWVWLFACLSIFNVTVLAFAVLTSFQPSM